MSDRTHRHSRLTMFVSPLLASGLLAAATIASLGCAQAESRNWAQTSPLIEPEKRADAGYHLSAHDDVVPAEDDDEADFRADGWHE